MGDVTELPIMQRNPRLAEDFLMHLARAQAVQPVYPLFHANVIQNALRAAIRSSDGMVTEVGDIRTVGDCRYEIETRDLNGKVYRITVRCE